MRCGVRHSPCNARRTEAPFEVLRRQDELLVARLRKITAVIDYLVATAELERLTGTILARHGIVLR